MDTGGLLSYGPDGWGDELLSGAWLTLSLALATLPIGLMLGLGLAVAKDSGRRWLAGFSDVFTTLFRSLPELLTILIVYFAFQILLRKIIGLLGFDASAVDVSGFVAGMVALGLVLAAFSSEVWLGALRAMPKGQKEGASALGLNRLQTFFLVTCPQLLRIAMPGLGNNWMALLKDTSLVSAIAVSDLMRQTNIAVGVTKQPILFYGVCCALYLLMAIASGIAQGLLERRLNRGQVRARA